MFKRAGYYAILFFGLAVVLSALGSMVLLLLNIPYQFASWWLTFGVTMLLFFLIVVIARYIILLLLGYLHHLESRIEEEDPHDLFEPPVTIIVPAYNEGAVIEQAVKSHALANAPAYQHPRQVIFIDEMPLAGTNKIDKRVLAQELARQIPTGGESQK